MFPAASEKLELYSGVNLEMGVEAVAHKLKGINGIERVTHVYFAGM